MHGGPLTTVTLSGGTETAYVTPSRLLPLYNQICGESMSAMMKHLAAQKLNYILNDHIAAELVLEAVAISYLGFWVVVHTLPCTIGITG